MEELEQCEKNVRGFKISGITTLALTGVGAGVNIGQSVKLKELEGQSVNLSSNISAKQSVLQSEQERINREQAQEINKITAFLAQLISDGDYDYYHGNDTTYREITGSSAATTSTSQPGTNDGVRQLQETEWAVKWNGQGVVYGTSVCNSNSGTYAVASQTEQTESKGKYCWCRMTNVAVADGTEYPSVGSWVFDDDNGSADFCAYDCARGCAYYVRGNSDFRSAVLGGGD